MSKTNTKADATAVVKKLQAKDPGLKRLLEKAYAYAVFPAVGKANLVIGGSYGKGEVFERGKKVGYATITQLTLGVQIGGDTFDEVVVFESKEAFERFKRGKTAFAANASAVLVKAGAASAKDFEKGAAVYVYPHGGMMLELAIGGQRFKFKPADEEQEQDEQQGKGKSANGKGAKGAEGRGGEDEEEDDQDQGENEGEEEGSDEESGGGNRALELAGRAVGGVRKAASKATDLVKRHPVMATVAGVGLAAGLGLLIARSFRSGGEDQGEDEQDNEGEEDQDEGAADSAEDSADDSSEEDQGEENQDDEGEEDESSDENEESENHGVLSRLLSRGRSRA